MTPRVNSIIKLSAYTVYKPNKENKLPNQANLLMIQTHLCYRVVTFNPKFVRKRIEHL